MVKSESKLGENMTDLKFAVMKNLFYKLTIIISITITPYFPIGVWLSRFHITFEKIFIVVFLIYFIASLFIKKTSDTCKLRATKSIFVTMLFEWMTIGLAWGIGNIFTTPTSVVSVDNAVIFLLIIAPLLWGFLSIPTISILLVLVKISLLNEKCIPLLTALVITLLYFIFMFLLVYDNIYRLISIIILFGASFLITKRSLSRLNSSI